VESRGLSPKVCDQSAGILLGREISDFTDPLMIDPVVVTDSFTAETGSLLTEAKVLMIPMNPIFFPSTIRVAGITVTSKSGLAELEPVTF
jgi:hypothetical protein